MYRATRLLVCALLAVAIGTVAGEADSAWAQAKRRPAAKKKGKAKPKAKPKLPDLKTPQDKLKFLGMIRQSMPTRSIGRRVSYTSEDLDKGLQLQIGLTRSRYARLIDDEAFVRRVYLDATGKVPGPGVVRQFVRDTSRDKRAQLVDRLLASKDHGRKWGRYWTSVIFHDSVANRNRINPKALEDWLAEQFQQDSPWDRIVAELVSATPVRNKEKRNDFGQGHGPNNFVLACENKPGEIASQTARLFMGISIQCAECHDHPFDQWKREQFHEMAAFFSRGKYFMPGQYDPAEKTEMKPRFLLGEKPPEYLKPDQRRVALAAYLIYNPDNYWFARAFVNRIWNELMGDGFYAVDSLGPDGDVVHKLVVNRIAAVFRYRQFDPKWVFRLIMNSDTYQREIRAPESAEELFTAVRPSRLRPDVVADSITRLTGANPGLERVVKQTFKLNPSIPQEDLEGSIQQALLMMNNRGLQGRLRNSALKKRLVKVKGDKQLVEELYLGVLARTPTESELRRSQEYIKDVGKRYEAVDDLIWVLVNSTEFLTKR